MESKRIQRNTYSFSHLLFQLDMTVEHLDLFLAVSSPQRPFLLLFEAEESIAFRHLSYSQSSEFLILSAPLYCGHSFCRGRIFQGSLLRPFPQLDHSASLCFYLLPPSFFLSIAIVGTSKAFVPYGTTDVAELCITCAGHVCLTGGEWDEAEAFVAPSPFCLFSHL
jgi:hypothetical protein